MTTCLMWPYFTVLLEGHIRHLWLYVYGWIRTTQKTKDWATRTPQTLMVDSGFRKIAAPVSIVVQPLPHSYAEWISFHLLFQLGVIIYCSHHVVLCSGLLVSCPFAELNQFHKMDSYNMSIHIFFHFRRDSIYSTHWRCFYQTNHIVLFSQWCQ